MVVIREATAADIPQVLQLQKMSYPTLAQFSAWGSDHLARHQARFGAGQLVAIEGDRVIGYSASLITSSAQVLRPHTFRSVTQHGTFDSHDPDGDALYGAEMMVHPDFRRLGVGSMLYAARFDLVRRFGLRYFIAGGRLPGYSEVADTLSIDAYVQEVIMGKREDRVLTPQLRNGLRVWGILPDYLKDPKSRNYAALVVWENTGSARPTSRLAEPTSASAP